jgi:hypothetical protein
MPPMRSGRLVCRIFTDLFGHPVVNLDGLITRRFRLVADRSADRGQLASGRTSATS